MERTHVKDFDCFNGKIDPAAKLTKDANLHPSDVLTKEEQVEKEEMRKEIDESETNHEAEVTEIPVDETKLRILRYIDYEG